MISEETHAKLVTEIDEKMTQGLIGKGPVTPISVEPVTLAEAEQVYEDLMLARLEEEVKAGAG